MRGDQTNFWVSHLSWHECEGVTKCHPTTYKKLGVSKKSGKARRKIPKQNLKKITSEMARGTLK
jgi:hypothetical protein